MRPDDDDNGADWNVLMLGVVCFMDPLFDPLEMTVGEAEPEYPSMI